MTTRNKERLFLLQVLPSLAAVWLFAGACGPSRETQARLQRAQAKLKEDWKSEVSKDMQETRDKRILLKGGFCPRQVSILVNLHNSSAPRVVEAEFERICAVDVPEFSHHDEELDKNYDHVVLMAMIERNMRLRDPKHLTRLLSHHCPSYVIYTALEFCLAYEQPGSVTILFDCYHITKSPAARRDIFHCLERAFPSLRVRFPVDQEFVQQAER